ncbi:hypothetical protein WA026_009172 [Henosepilachna vigintioctopunctata]|uniref:Major facilitator superfamily (MFS) profile domain-containing protein n=1 Tax=Henosepilachna vigintioctopunctata TaxID=420089 RepID=A0AAW1UMX7_9CUCU
MKSEKEKDVIDTEGRLLKPTGGATFEEAISATKFGKFNWLLILVIIPSRWSPIFETTTMSYVFPAAQCDLDLTLDNKGLLNAITYAGMVSSAFIWGYLFDSLGRKKLMYIAYFSDACFVFLTSLSQTFPQLLLSKFLGGFIINGPFAALTTYVCEFHSAKYRTKIQMVIGIISSFGSVFLPLLAGLILPAKIEFTLFNYLNMHSWNVFLMVVALPSFFGGIMFFLMPESPKFLMTNGRNEEALEVMRFVYKMNTGQPKNTYPIDSLVLERKQKDTKKDSKRALVEGLNQLKPLFVPPFLQNILLLCGMQMLIMMSIITLRLWLPQLFQAINDYEHLHNGTTSSLCKMLEVIHPAPKNGSDAPVECTVNNDNYQVYVNNMIVAAVAVFGYFIVGSLINNLGKKRLLFGLNVIGGLCGFGLYFAQSSNMTLIMSAVYIGVGSISINIIISVAVDLFPTTLRTMTVSITMMVGRLGAMSGNLIFPYLLKQGCAPPFFTIGTGLLSCAFIGILLPNTDMKALQ